MMTKLDSLVTFHTELQLIFSITMSMVTKLIRMGRELSTIYSHDPSMRWSCEFTWLIK